jgi:DNA-directed RNA polymerase subunit beta'
MPTLGQFLVNDVLPESYKLSGPITNRGLHDHVVDLAKKNPSLYVKTIMDLKRRGDEIATVEGVSVGLDDIEPNYEARDKIVRTALKAIAQTDDPRKHERIVVDTQARLLEHTKEHQGSMTHMALSGARGNIGQLMKIVATPLAAVHPQHGVSPILIDKSYAEGISPAQYWLTAPEVRANEVTTRISVSEPGEMAKVLVNNLISNVISGSDCGTQAGVMMSLTDGHILDRYTQATHALARNTLITPQLVQQLTHRGERDLLVRSPMTCAAPHGVCQHCQGLNERGQNHAIGITVGVRAAQAMAEPLTQMSLSAKHGTLTVRESASAPTGTKGVRQLLEIPKAFKFEAVLAPAHGAVEHIEPAPQGGHYLTVAGKKLYAKPELKITVTPGQTVEAGDALTDGIPHPAKVVAAKGIGAGRAYFVEALHNVYKREGVNLDRRHLELLAKSDINHVKLLDVDADHPELLKGDVINYNTFRDAYVKDATSMPLHLAVGRRLGQEILHHTVGTLITPSISNEMKAKGITDVRVAKSLPRVEFVMKPFAVNPLLERDWVARLSHRQLKTTLQEAAHFGEVSDLHGSHPVPAYAFGAELTHGPNGTF